jgi:hypothetical protein
MSTTIVALAIKTHPRPETESYYRRCDLCNQMIWLALNSPQADHLVCQECFASLWEPELLASGSLSLHGVKA